RAAVGHEGDAVLADAEGVQERAALGRGAVSGDPLAFSPEPVDEGEQASPEVVYSAAEGPVRFEIRDSPSPLLFEQGVPGRALVATFAVPDEEPQRSAVDGQALDVLQYEPVAREQGHEGGDREVAEVLVVDRVELQAVEEVLEVRDLDHGDAPGLEQ